MLSVTDYHVWIRKCDGNMKLRGKDAKLCKKVEELWEKSSDEKIV